MSPLTYGACENCDDATSRNMISRGCQKRCAIDDVAEAFRSTS